MNLKLLQKVKDSRDELGHPKLIDFGNCNLHTVHGALSMLHCPWCTVHGALSMLPCLLVFNHVNEAFVCYYICYFIC